MKSTAFEAWNSAGSSVTYTWGPNSTGAYCICNCIFHRSCSFLRFCLCMWLAFVLMLTIFIILKQNFLFGKLSCHKKHLRGDRQLLISRKKACQTKSFALGWWKIVGIRTKANYTHRKIFRTLQNLWRMQLWYLDVSTCVAHAVFVWLVLRYHLGNIVWLHTRC